MRSCVLGSAATIADTIKHDMHHYGFSKGKDAAESFDWAHLKKGRDAYVLRLNGIYRNGLKSSGVDEIEGHGSFIDRHSIKVTSPRHEDKIVTGKYILIATGGRPIFPPGEGMKEHCISSDGFFELEELPKVAVVIGAGYIAVELAGVLNSLGSEVHLVVRKECALREFDPMISAELDKEMVRQGITIHRQTGGAEKVEIDNSTGKKIVTFKSGDVVYGADIVLMAVGRQPNVESLNLDKVGVKIGRSNHVVADEYCTTSVDNIFALGDDVGIVELTPMAIASGRRLSDRIFGGVDGAKASFENVPTVVFAHPTIGTIGLTEPKAIAKYGEQNIKVYNSKFANLYYGIFNVEPEKRPKTAVKLICAGESEKIVGIHIIGMGADEMLQGFGVAVKMGATKADLDSCVAIHPTASEELVTMGAWCTSPQVSGAKVSPLNGALAAEAEMSKM